MARVLNIVRFGGFGLLLSPGTHDETLYRMNTWLRLLAYSVAATLLASRSVFASGYQDVAVVVNTNSQVSLAIGSYYQSAHGIPEINIIRVNTTTDETIDDAVFASLRSQIECHLRDNNLADSINYIVTTKGVPLRIDRGDVTGLGCTSASVESELMCVLGPYSGHIGQGGGVLSPYFGKTEHFSHMAFGIYLVTRLDGYSLRDVTQLIDKSGPGVHLGPASSFILDRDPLWGDPDDRLNSNLTKARDILAGSGARTILNTDTVFLTQEPDIAGYASWGSNDHHASRYSNNGSPHNTWAHGAIAETYVSTSARSFIVPVAPGQSLIADLIQEGASGAKGYVFEPYSSAMADVSILFGRYISGYNLAESYFSASQYLSWMDVVVGDPKTSIVFPDGPPLPVQLSSFEALSLGEGSVRVAWTTLSEINSYGFTVERHALAAGTFSTLPSSFTHGAGTSLSTHEYSWIDTGIPPGSYAYRLSQTDLDGTVHLSEARDVTLLQNQPERGEGSPVPGTFCLYQNYPNPFNPSTTIRYTLRAQAHVTLSVFNTLGQQVAVLQNSEQDAGYHEVKFGGSGLASGVYFYRIRAGDFIQTKRLSLLR